MSRVAYEPLTTEAIADITGTDAADLLGELNEAIKDLKRDIGSMKEILKSEAPEGGEISGYAYTVTITNSERTSLDTASVRAEMGDDWYLDHCKTSDIQTVRSFKTEN